MEIKKSPKADLEKKRGLFLQAGLLIVIVVILIAFRLSSSNAIVVSESSPEDSDNANKTALSSAGINQNPVPDKTLHKSSASTVSASASEEQQVAASEQITENLPNSNEETKTLLQSETTEENLSDSQASLSVDHEEDVPVFYLVEEMPEFPGGDGALGKYLAGVRYPASALENEIQGRVYISFVINAKGLVEDIKVARGVDPSLDKAALEQVKKMPPWRPGKQQGRPVKVSYTVPINFVLSNR